MFGSLKGVMRKNFQFDLKIFQARHDFCKQLFIDRRVLKTRLFGSRPVEVFYQNNLVS